MSEETEAPDQYATDDFSAAFGDAMEPASSINLSDDGSEPVITIGVDGAVSADSGAAPEAKAADAVATSDTAAPDADAAAAAAAEAAAATQATAEPEIPAGLAPEFLAQAQAEAAAAATAATAAAQAPAPVAAEPEKPYVPYIADDFLTPEAKASVEKFRADWPDDWRAVQSMYQSEVQAQVANAHNALVKQLNSVLAPLFQSAERTEVNSHNGAIRAAHSDYETVLPAVRGWVAEQPSFLKAAYDAVLKGGSAQDVVDLVTLYKGAMGVSAAPTPALTPTPALRVVPAAKPGVDPAAVAATAAVPAALRAKPAASADPNDFSAAFAEASALTS